MTHRLNMLYKCKIRWNTSNGYRVKERTQNSIANYQREITQKYQKQSYGSYARHILSLCSRSVWSFNQIALTVFNLSGQNIAFSYVTRGIIWKTNMQELWFLCMTRCLNVLYKCMKFRWNTSNSYQVIELTQNSIVNDQREITPKISKAELWFLCMTHRLNVHYKCMKFHWNTFNGYQAIECTRNSIANDQREITPKISKADLWFLCMTRHLNVHYKCMKFRWNISNGFQIIDWTRFWDRQMDERTDRWMQGKKQNVSRPFQGET